MRVPILEHTFDINIYVYHAFTYLTNTTLTYLASRPLVRGEPHALKLFQELFIFFIEVKSIKIFFFNIYSLATKLILVFVGRRYNPHGNTV